MKRNDKIITTKILDIEYAYPIYDRNWKESREIIHSWLKKQGIFSIGRYGSWKYSPMEEAILDGKRTAEEILKKC